MVFSKIVVIQNGNQYAKNMVTTLLLGYNKIMVNVLDLYLIYCEDDSLVLADDMSIASGFQTQSNTLRFASLMIFTSVKKNWFTMPRFRFSPSCVG